MCINTLRERCMWMNSWTMTSFASLLVPLECYTKCYIDWPTVRNITCLLTMWGCGTHKLMPSKNLASNIPTSTLLLILLSLISGMANSVTFEWVWGEGRTWVLSLSRKLSLSLYDIPLTLHDKPSRGHGFHTGLTTCRYKGHGPMDLLTSNYHKTMYVWCRGTS